MKIVKKDKVQFARRHSDYSEIFKALRALKGPEDVLLLPMKGLDGKTVHNRLNSALRREGLEPSKPGYRWTRHVTDDGHMAIYMVKDTRTKKAPAKKKAKKKS